MMLAPFAENVPKYRAVPGFDERSVPDLARITMEWVVAPPLWRLHAAQQGAIGDAGGGEHDVALRHVGQIVFAGEVGDAPPSGSGALVITADQQAALHLAAEAAQSRRRQHPFGSAADAQIHVGRRCAAGRWR